MKLASVRRGRDGALVVISRDLTRAISAESIASTLQAALDDWQTAEPKLRALSASLEQDVDVGFAFNPHTAAAPLPRAYQWLDASAYVNHVALVREARGAVIPDTFWTDPLMYQGGSDSFLGPEDPIVAGDESWGIDFEAELGVVLGDVPMAPTRAEAERAIRLFVLINDVSLRHILVHEIRKELGFVQAKPSSAFAPAAVTPDELGEAWDGGRLHLPMLSNLNGSEFGKPNIGVDMTFDFPELIMHAARTRPLGAGTILGSGTISNRGPDGGCGRPIDEGGLGYSCIAEMRTVEKIRTGAVTTNFMHFGDRVTIAIAGRDGQNIFGTINQEVVPLSRPAP